MQRRALWQVPLGVVAVILAVHYALVLSAAPMRPVRIDPLQEDAALAPVDARLDDARRYAPWILHETDASELGRQDIPAAMDFDGDVEGDDNWDDFPRFAQLPTVYYSVAETQTHLFLSYHLYHARDWAPRMSGLHDTHEGDGENLQVVVAKATGLPVLLYTQAHYLGVAHRSFETVETHAAVFVEAEGHGIYATTAPESRARVNDTREGLVVYRAALDGERVVEPGRPYVGTFPYRLVSLSAFVAAHGGLDALDARLFDGDGRYENRRFPLYHEGERYSGPLGADRGISPYALGFSYEAGAVGALYLDPARAYAEAGFAVEPWSREYFERPG